MNAATKTGLDALKTATKKLVHKAGEATGEFLQNKIADKTVKPKLVHDENSRNIEEIVIAPEKREEILNELRQYYKMKHYKISKFLHDSAVSNLKPKNKLTEIIYQAFNI